MSNVSIFEKKWIDLVFENKNQDYGAYQLRREHPKTTLVAFFIGIGFFTTTIITFLLINIKSGEIIPPVIDDFGDKVFRVSKWITPKSEEPQKKSVAAANNDKPKDNLTKKDLVNATIVRHDEEHDEINTNDEMNQNKTTVTSTSTSGNVDGSKEGNGDLTNSNTNSTLGGDENTENPAIIRRSFELDKSPEYPGGIDKFYRYVAHNFRATEVEERDVISIMVSFVIEKDGSISNIRILRNQGEKLDNEAIRVLKSLKTKWKPGERAGKPVRTEYILPIKVKVS